MNLQRLIKQCSAICGNNDKLAKYLKCNVRTIYRWKDESSVPKPDYITTMYELVMKTEKKIKVLS